MDRAIKISDGRLFENQRGSAQRSKAQLSTPFDIVMIMAIRQNAPDQD